MTRRLSAFVVIGFVVMATALWSTAQVSGASDCPMVVRAYFADSSMVADVASWTEPWEVHKDLGYIVVAVDETGLARLESAGFQVEVDAKLTIDLCTPRQPLEGQEAGIPGYPCYRTVEETFQAAQDLVTAYPELASWIDVGDSWEKTAAGGLPGYDMMVLKITNANVPGTPTGQDPPHGKPRLFVTSSIHAREYATAELVTRFAEYLLSNYGVDADATWLVDEHEIHLMLYTNPDGRKHAETGDWWRKNTNESYCSPTSSSRGADLNRNFAFQWGCCGGSSGSQCDDTYRGPSAGSEPETQAVQSYLLGIFPDQRDPSLSAAAPDGSTGVYVDIHSYSELVLWPWGFTSAAAPNATALQTLGRKFAYYNNYYPDQAIGLYATDGTTDDYGYGELGVPSYCFEVGTSFFQDCSSFENTILPDNLKALVYAAKVARTPYLTPSGPEVRDIAFPGGTVLAPGDTLEVQAVVDDTRFNNSNGSEPSQNISAAAFTVDVPPWDAAAPAPVAMTAADGSFNSSVETVEASMSTAALGIGRHILFFWGTDASADDGPISAAFFWVSDPATAPHIAGTVQSSNGPAPLAATITAGTFSTTSSAVDGSYDMMVVEGSYDVTASAPDHIPGTVTGVTVTTGVTATVDFTLTYRQTPDILLVDDDDNNPDVQSSYTDLLDAMAIDYDIWDTANSDNEPSAAELAPYGLVIWFTGHEYGGAAGPGSAGESALASWLNGGGCLLMTAQDYYYDRGLTSFMSTYLGVASATSDVSQTSVTGAGTVFSGLGPYSLSYPYSNFSDTVNPASGAETAFTGNQGSAAVSKDSGIYKTTFWGFPFETLPSQTAREEAMNRLLAWCQPAADGNVDGVVHTAPSRSDLSGTTVEARQSSSGTVVATAGTGAAGAFGLVLAPDDYDIVVSRPGFLWASTSATVAAGSTVTLSAVTLPGGDIDGNDTVNIVDISGIAGVFGTADATSDLDGNGTVNVVDLAGAASHFGQSAPAPW